MPKKASTPSRNMKVPKAGRPHIADYGIPKSKKGILPWKWAQNKLGKSRQYWIATARPDGSAHLMIIWGLWQGDRFYFSTGKNTRKARNLAANPRCVIGTEDAAQAVIVEGVIEDFDMAPQAKALFAAYKKKYKMDVSGMGEPLFRVRPQLAFGFIEKKFPTTATRWSFS